MAHLYFHNLHYEKFPDGTVKCIEDEIPFELPEGWEWTRLDILTTLVTDYVANGSFATLKANVRTYKEKNYALFVRTVDFANNFEKDLSYIDKESYDFLDKSRLYGGELMLSNIGASIGKVFKIPYFDFPMSLAPNSIIHKFHYDSTSDFFEYVFRSFVGQDYLQRLTAGTAMPKFNKTELKQMLVPLPTLTEQERIIAKIKELLSIVDFIESDKTDLQTTIQLTKSKILDLAIRGKLVPQNPYDEPASTLLDRIRAEKEELIKQSKIKRDKKESVIYKGDDNSYYEKIGSDVRCIDEELPFEVPDSWAFLRLKEIWELISGRDLSPSEYNASENGIPYITGASNFINGSVELVRWTPSPQVITEYGDLLLTCKGTIGEMAINDFGSAHIARQIMAIRNHYNLNTEYLLLCLKFHIDNIKSVAKGLIPGISREDILNLIIPLPPQEYQVKIVLRTKEIERMLSEIEKSLS